MRDFHARRCAAPVLAAVLALVACDRPPGRPGPDGPVAAPDPPPTFVSIPAPPAAGAIQFRVTAPRDRPLFLDNCNGAISWGLMEQHSGGWRPAWGAELDACHSAPIEIAPGTSLGFREVLGIRPDTPLAPGVYRVAVHGLYFAHDSQDHARNAEVPLDSRMSLALRFGP